MQFARLLKKNAALVAAVGAVCFFLLGMAGSAGARIIYVDGDGPADFNNIQAAQIIRPEYVPNEIIVKFHKTVADTVEKQLEFNTLVRGLKLPKNLGELNTRYRIRRIDPLFKNFRKKRQRVSALLAKNEVLLTKKEKHILRRSKRAPKGAKVPDLDRIYRLEFDLEAGQSLEELVAVYNNDPGVEYAALNYYVSGCKTPNDPLYSIQWPLNNIGQVYPESGNYNTPPGTPDADIDAPEAWNLHTGSWEIIVAVIDTGVDYTHRDMQASMWVNSGEIPDNGVDDDDNGYIDDIYGYDFYNDDHDPLDDDGHGTHCAGIIAAAGNNGTDIAGVCWKARVMALKFMGVDTIGTMGDSIEAFYYAVENGADVISNSWGTGYPFEPLEEVFEYVSSQGVINVFSAGNRGNTLPHYPAYYDHVIAVAATNSNDERAPFSTYGSWVEIAAPGVDILSLLSSVRDKGTPYDQYTTIMSGTSMACPHVAGVCALLLSVYDALEVNEVTNILQQTADPITPGLCASGRLNLYEALEAVAVFEAGIVNLDRDVYSCSDTVQITVRDLNLQGNGLQEVTIESNSSDLEMVDLTETSLSSGVFTGIISTNSGQTNIGDDILQVSHGSIISVTYYDANDGTGNPATVTDSARTDCRDPIISNVLFDEYPQGPELMITFETDEPTTTRVLCGLACGGPYTAKSNNIMSTYHAILLDDDIMQPDNTNYFVIEVNDIVGNHTTDDDNGTCYAFITTGPRDINVPDEYATIQEAIADAWDGSTIWVADGIYTGQGNKTISFDGKAVTLKSENGPNECTIDCQDDGRPFYFQNDECSSTRVIGFTILNGSQALCNSGSPVIANCIFDNNSGQSTGGVRCLWGSNPVISNCVFSGQSGKRGSQVYIAVNSRPIINNCIFEGGDSTAIACKDGSDEGGCIPSCPTISNCLIYGIYATAPYHCPPAILLEEAGSATTVQNCVIAGNYSNRWAAGIWCTRSDVTIKNCTIVGNSSQEPGGGIGCYDADPVISNCITWGNQPPNGPQIVLKAGSNPSITYCDVQGGWPGEGNNDTDPCFVEPGHWGNVNDPNVLVEPNDPNAVWVNGDYHLLPDSPCIDRGDNNSVPADVADLDGDGDTNEPIPFDLDGNPRIADGDGDGIAVVDMGAYEVAPAYVSCCFGVNHLKIGQKGRDLDIKGTFKPIVPVDLSVDGVTFIIDDGEGNMLDVFIPAGSFKTDGKAETQRFKYDSPKKIRPEIKAKFDFGKCRFELKAKKISSANQIKGTTLGVALYVGNNVGEEVLEVQDKKKHLEYKRRRKVDCCRK